MTLQAFINESIRQKIDFDGAYGAQCVDLFRQYCRDVLNITVHTGAVEGAKDLIERWDYLPIERNYFNRLARTASPVIGDVVVYGATDKNKYGHVAIFIAEHNGGQFVLEQDGYKQDGCKIAYREKRDIIGYLRRKPR